MPAQGHPVGVLGAVTAAPGGVHRVEGFQDGSGLFGVAGHPEAARLVVLGLRGLQHRGDHGAAVAVGDGNELRSSRCVGRVDRLNEGVASLAGDRAIGHVTGGIGAPGVVGLPLDGGDRMALGHGHHGSFACAVAGRFTNGTRLRRELKQKGALLQSESDAEVLLHLIAQSSQKTRVNRLVDALWKVEGAFSVLLLGPDVLVAVRDPRGFRPLFMGDLQGVLIVATEGAAIRDAGGKVHRALLPGEMVVAHREGVDFVQPFPPQKPSRCLQEIISLARSDTDVFGRSPYRSRIQLGERLGMDAPPLDGEVVVCLPGDEAYAMGYARHTGLPFERGISDSDGRWIAVRAVVRGRRVVLVARSLITGVALRKGVRLLRDAGTVEIHVRIATPPVERACLYGVPSPTTEELAWFNRPDVEELGVWMDASSLQFQAAQGLRGVLGSETWCQACLTGVQPVVPEEPDDQLPLF